MTRTITIDPGLEADLAAFRKARAARQALPPSDIDSYTFKNARDRELDAALDLACAIDARAPNERRADTEPTSAEHRNDPKCAESLARDGEI